MQVWKDISVVKSTCFSCRVPALVPRTWTLKGKISLMQVFQLWKEKYWDIQELRNTTKLYHTTNLPQWERPKVSFCGQQLVNFCHDFHLKVGSDCLPYTIWGTKMCVASLPPRKGFATQHDSTWKYDNSILIWNDMPIARLDRILNGKFL